MATADVIKESYSTIMMSGTLTPTSMYKDLLGFPPDALEAEYPDPFPKHNRLNLIVPGATTKYSLRGEEQYKKIASITAEITNEVPGNTLLFFPSYNLRDSVYEHFSKLCKKTTILEMPNLSKEEKIELLESFKENNKPGSVLLAVNGGSFSEGIDLPGDLLKCVVVVGLPLHRLDLESEALIKYYNGKFGKGMDYGYIFPAFNKVLQSAGRCIRGETDRGVIVFLDERYAWPNYQKNFPEGWDIHITRAYVDQIKAFFGT